MNFICDYAERFSIEALLNCYIREFALPNEQVQFTPIAGGFRVALPPMTFTFTVTHLAPLANYKYTSGPQINGECLSLQGVAEQIFASVQKISGKQIASQAGSHIDYSELLEQVEASHRCMQALLSPALVKLPQEAAFLASEQQLKVGHRFHPTPKARIGMSESDWQLYSPETGANFAWHAFAISPQQYDGSELMQAFVKQQWMPALANHQSAILPVHPWQAQFLLKQPEVIELMENGSLEYLGEQGKALYATSSLRSCYHPDLDYFCKGSLHVRLTNCLRKNARYELETAKILSGVLTDICQEQPIADFSVLAEPEFQTIASDKKILSEGFAVILRQNPFTTSAQRSAMSGALFAPQVGQKSLVHGELARTGNTSMQGIEIWFERYAQLIITPTLRLFFEHGIVLEPHLQNCVVALTDGLPSHFYYRDLEGTKLVEEMWPTLPKMSDEAQQAVVYDQQKGWHRINYCLWLNHFSEAIAALAYGNGQVESRLWDIVAQVLVQHSEQYEAGQAQVAQLLTRPTLPNKANLLVRFLRQADKQAQYIHIHNPIAAAHAHQLALEEVAA